MSINNSLLPFFKPFIDEREYQAVEEFLSSPFALGQAQTRLEANFAVMFENRQCLAVKSGTAALFLSLLALGISNGDEVIVSDVVCEGVLNAIEQLGAIPVLIDIETQTANIDCSLISDAITHKTKCIIAVHYGGIPCNIEAIITIAKEFGIYVIEDCAQALGAKIHNRLCGQYADIAIFSFYANKIITCGEGGAIVATPELIKKITSYVYDKRLLSNQTLDNVNIIFPMHEILLDDLSATIATTQLTKLDEILSRRKQIAEKYNAKLSNLCYIKIPSVSYERSASFYQYVITTSFPTNISTFLNTFNKKNIRIFPDFVPNHQRMYYKNKYQLREDNFPKSSYLSRCRFCLPLYPTMPAEHVDYIISTCVELLIEPHYL